MVYFRDSHNCVVSVYSDPSEIACGELGGDIRAASIRSSLCSTPIFLSTFTYHFSRAVRYREGIWPRRRQPQRLCIEHLCEFPPRPAWTVLVQANHAPVLVCNVVRLRFGVW